MAAQVGEVTTGSLSGWFKQVYSDDVINLIPNATPLQKEIGFETSKRLGDKYHQPIVVSEESGFTYAASGAGAFSLNSPIAMSTQDAQVDGYQIVLIGRMDYETAARAVSSKASFGQATQAQVKNMLDSARRRLEMLTLYGQSAMGSTQSTGSSNTNGTTEVIQLTTASWATGIWAGRKNAQIVFYDSSTLVSSAADAIFVVSSVDVTNKRLTVTGTSTGITALNTAVTNAAKNLDVHWYGSVTGSLVFAVQAGIDKVVTNTGTLFNVDATAYDLFQGNVYDALSGQLTLQKVIKAVAVAVGRGLDEDVVCFVSPATWTDLAADQASLRRHGATETASNGFRAIEFYHMNGIIKIQGHAMCKEGEAFILPLKRFRRIGSQDVSFTMPGNPDKDMFIELQSNAGFEYRLYSHQALFCDTPAKCVKIKNIVNGS